MTQDRPAVPHRLVTPSLEVVAPRPETRPPPVANAFDRAVPFGGYRWWYLDGVSDDGRFAVVIIAFVGHVFSPGYYARRGAGGGAADPEAFCALNVAIYRMGRLDRWLPPISWLRDLWTLREYDRDDVVREPARFALRNSAMAWEGDELVVSFDERTAPLGRPLRGRVSLRPAHVFDTEVSLGARARHAWRPVAPVASFELALERPRRLCFSGHGYHDSNSGSEALEAGFSRWSWSRAALDGGTAVLYDVTELDGALSRRGWLFGRDGTVEPFAPSGQSRLRRTRWWLERTMRHDGGRRPRIARVLEDGPFYARSLLETHLAGQSVQAVHEQLDLRRFRRAWVRRLIPYRMWPRSFGPY